jgi:Fic family protein
VLRVATYGPDASQKGGFDDMTVPAWQPERPWNELPNLRGNNRLEPVAVLRRCIEARAALAGLKEAVQLIPNPAMLINTLPVLEAQASSEIENIVTTADELFQYAQRDEMASPAAKEALRYRSALLEAFEGLRQHPLGTRSAEQVCTRIRGVETAVRRVPGTRLHNPATGETIYTPPEGEDRLRELLADWEAFLHEEGPLDPLVRMAAAHYQFEAIHPFTDGNGRTGRVLNSLYLVECGLLPLPILYLSRFVIRNKSEYYERLLAVTREGAWEPWILYMLAAVEETAGWTLRKLHAIRELSEVTREHVQHRLPRVYSHELVDVLFSQPYCRIANVVDANIAGRQAAARWLKDLVAIGVLREIRMGREKLFLHSKLLALLTSEANKVVRY